MKQEPVPVVHAGGVLMLGVLNMPIIDKKDLKEIRN